ELFSPHYSLPLVCFLSAEELIDWVEVAAGCPVVARWVFYHLVQAYCLEVVSAHFHLLPLVFYPFDPLVLPSYPRPACRLSSLCRPACSRLCAPRRPWFDLRCRDRLSYPGCLYLDRVALCALV